MIVDDFEFANVALILLFRSVYEYGSVVGELDV